MLSVTEHEELVLIRQDLHAYPELRFEEKRTAGIVADYLVQRGFRPRRGFAKTGVVATLDTGRPGPSIMLRADMDALPIQERGEAAYRSRHDGTMHACGHDGHTAMLLGAATALAKAPPARGKVHFVFQPAEEGGAGADVMIREGFLSDYPIDACFGLHNWPGLAPGRFGVRSGPVMAGGWRFVIEIRGKGAHAAQPHAGCDVIVAAAAIVQAAQTLVSRRCDPLVPAVVSICTLHAGRADNVLPDTAELAGTIRALDEAVLDRLREGLEAVAVQVAGAYGVTATLRFHGFYPVTVNAPVAADCARAVIRQLDRPGFEEGMMDIAPSLASEDFAFFLRERPGAYVMIGNGKDSAPLHVPTYDFNDRVIGRGVEYWTTLAHHVTGLCEGVWT